MTERISPDRLRTFAQSIIICDVLEDAAKMIANAANEIERLRAIVRVNGIRAGYSHTEIDTVLDGVEPDGQKCPRCYDPLVWSVISSSWGCSCLATIGGGIKRRRPFA